MNDLRRAPPGNRLARACALTCVTVGSVATGHLLVLLVPAALARKRHPTAPSSRITFAVVIPAHNEESQIGRTLTSVRACSYPSVLRRVVVVADNCTDRTADVARSAGAEVWERRDADRRGKGYALDWAFSRLLDDPRTDAVCVIDADCEVSPNLLSALAARLMEGAEAVQSAYLISNPDESPAAALRWAGFGLFNFVRPLGRHRLGLSCGLLGSGMAFSRELLLRSPWSAFSYAEDREQHMRWVLDGVRVEFAAEARVASHAPNAAAAGKTQAARWDSGRGNLARRLTPKLLARWLGTGDSAALDAALEPLLPPQSVLLGINLSALLMARVTRRSALARVAMGAAVGQVAYVLGGLAALNAPPSVWRSLLAAPRFVLRRVGWLFGSLIGRGPTGWERTQRDPGESVKSSPTCRSST